VARRHPFLKLLFLNIPHFSLATPILHGGMAVNLSCTRYWRRQDLWRCARSQHGPRPLHVSAAAPDFTTTYCDRECSREGWRRPLGSPNDPADRAPIVALGKFDALHRGHRALAAAAAGLGGAPWLVSFAGMAEVLHWPRRLPLVALPDRRRVMQTWAPSCGGLTPIECSIPFAEVRSLAPDAFVALLADELKVAGVAVGSNYRFGYRAAGDAALLRDLGAAHGLKVAVVDLVEHEGAMDGETVSSSWVREALGAGDVEAAAYCLGRPYRLVVQEGIDIKAVPEDIVAVEIENSREGLEIKGWFGNQPPASGRYIAMVQAAAAEERLLGHVEAGVMAEVEVGEGRVRVAGLPPTVATAAAQPSARLVIDFDRRLS
jgi:hypothetical protein